MKKFFYTMLIIFIMDKLYCYNFVNWADYYMYSYKENGRKNFFPFFVENLKKNYNIKVFIYKDSEKTQNIQQKAEKIYNEIKSQNMEKILLIFINLHKKVGKILIEPDLEHFFKKENIKILESEILSKFTGRWYIDELSLYTKIIGTFFYLLEKKNLSKTEIERLREEIIIIDDFLFNLAMQKPFSDILQLFYFEPISFIFYFPFITYFILVRMIGYNFGINGFRIANVIWSAFMLLIVLLIYNKIQIIFPEYLNLFLMFCGLSMPIHIYLYHIYKEEIQCALYGYFNSITGGFNENIFQKN